MAHPDSVLDTSIANYRQDFYDKLADMEAYTYDNSSQPANFDGTGTAGVAEYQPFWQAYSDAIVGYLGNSIGGQASKDYIIALYAYLSQFETKGRGSQSTVDASDAQVIFDLDGLVSTVLGYALGYYDDFQPGDPNDPESTDSAPNLEADTAHASGAWSADNPTVESLRQTYITTLTDGSIQDIFAYPPDPPQGDWNGLIAWDYVFDTLEWEWAADQGFLTLTVPPRPTP